MEDFSKWIGKTEIAHDDMSVATAQLAAATFNDDASSVTVGSPLPPLWHWFYFLPKAPQDHLGEDGHPQRDDQSFMPPVPFPRRMFAGASIRWHQPLLVGQAAERESTIDNIVQKSGRSGELVFVTVTHKISQGGHLCLEETQDLVYRQPGPPLPAPVADSFPPPPEGTQSQELTADPRLLFRYSALTFNAHRIHYDRPYATGEEGYPALIVHGQLVATYLVRLAKNCGMQDLAAFQFRSQVPLFDSTPFRLLARSSEGKIELEAQRSDGKTSMLATAELPD